MRVVVAPDAFKGTLTARQAAESVAAGWARARPGDAVEVVPMSDGGPGFLDAVAPGLGGELRETPSSDPLGRPVRARLLLAGDTCYLESADCCGLHLVPPPERNPLHSSSTGLAAVLLAAADTTASRVVVGLGGSATNDGGAGLLAGLGFRLLDVRDGELPPEPAALGRLARIAVPRDPPALPHLVAATDVDSPLLGPHGASRMFGPQKGVTPAEVALLEERLARLAATVGRDLPGAAGAEDRPGAGAAGGLGYGLFALGASQVPGAEVVIEATQLRDRVRGAGLVVTGEGAFDRQSLRGKVVAGVAAVAKRHGVPCVVLAGRVRLGRREAARAGVRAAYALEELAGSAAEARARAAELLERLAAQVASGA